MKKYTTTFQHPFEENEIKKENLSKEDVLNQFKEINWLQLDIDSYEKHDNVIHDYYYFEVEYFDLMNDVYLLNIAGQYTIRPKSINDLKFWLHFDRPKLVVKKKLFGLLGSEEVMQTVSTEMEDRSYEFTLKCLHEFANQNFSFLEQNMFNYTTD